MHHHPLRTVLAIRLSSIGDVLLATPFLRVFKRRHADCALHVAVRAEYRELLEHNPHVDRLIAVDLRAGRRGLEGLNHELLAESYDAVFDLQHNFRSHLIANGLSPHIHRVNKRQVTRFALVHFGVDLYRDSVQVPDRYIETAHAYGVRPDSDGPEFFLPPGIEHDVHLRMRGKGLEPGERIVALCPGSKHFTKQWPLERYRELASMLLAGGWRIAVFGGPEDANAGLSLEQIDPLRVHSFCGSLTLSQTASGMDHCAAVVANDSGLMHVATARKRPVVALFGSTTHHFGFFPYHSAASVLEVQGLSCRPCSHIGRTRCPKGHFRCMQEITAGMVYKSLGELLG